MSHSAPVSSKGLKGTLLMSLGALGVVYGDIGTSPLYAINEMFFGHGELHITPETILGAISIVFWAVTLIISFKYVIYVLRADYDGEGGVFALYGLLDKYKQKSIAMVTVSLIFAAGLLFGDGIITPAISVLSAVEGLKIATVAFEPYVIPLTVVILTGLFLIQSKGTSQVGKLFGPVISVWFLAIGTLGFLQIIKNPSIIGAINPYHAYWFVTHTPIHTLLLVLGSVMLCVTGGEAMYADMGHFGRSPIRISWFGLTYPALMLNYFGQGAFLLSGQEPIAGNIFFSLVPKPFLYPMVLLATMATVIASQALISGGFSLFTQAVGLGLLPRTMIKHTHEEHIGQIYVPFVNWALYVGCIALVFVFRSSGALASAYGLAVSGVMLITTVSMHYIATKYWKWATWKSIALFLPLGLVDASFLTANTLKVFQGGYIPLAIAFGILVVMKTWQWGRAVTKNAFNAYPSMSMKDLVDLKNQAESFLPRSIVIMTPEPIEKLEDKLPPLKQIFWERYGMLPKDLVFLTVIRTKEPYIHDKRYKVTTFYDGNGSGRGSIASVQLHFGFLEDPNVEEALEGIAKHHEVKIEEDHNKWLIHTIQERLFLGGKITVAQSLRFELYKIIYKLASTAEEYFGLGREKGLTTEILPVFIK